MAVSLMSPPTKRGSIPSAMMWMFALQILLIWLPFAGSFIAGFVGGKRAGDLGNAVVAVLLPMVVFSIALGILAHALIPIPFIGSFAGLGGFAFAATHVFPLLFGAALGGLTVDKGGAA